MCKSAFDSPFLCAEYDEKWFFMQFHEKKVAFLFKKLSFIF